MQTRRKKCGLPAGARETLVWKLEGLSEHDIRDQVEDAAEEFL